MYDDYEKIQSQEKQIREDLIDAQVLSNLLFQQRAERKSWQGIRVQYSGIPGTAGLEINERMLLFQEELQEIEAQDKLVDILREFLDII